MKAYQIELDCGHKGLVGGCRGKTPPVVGNELLCPEHGLTSVKKVVVGKIEAFRGFVADKVSGEEK